MFDMIAAILASLGFINWAFLVVSIILFLGMLFQEGDKIKISVMGGLGVLFALMWFVGSGSFVVQPAQRAIVIYINGMVDDNTLGPGLHSRPLIGAWINTYPGQTDYQWCPEFTPGVQGGIEIKATICMRLNLSNVDWRNQYIRWRKNDVEIFDAWRNEIAPLVASVFSQVSPLSIREDRLGVTERVGAAISGWFSQESVPVSKFALVNWDFTSDDVRAQYDSQVTNTLRQEAVQAARRTAEQERDLELYNVETYRQVSASRASAEREALSILGLSDTERVYYLIQSRLVSYLESSKDASVVVTVGGDGAPFVKNVP